MEHTSSKNFILWIVLFMVIVIAGVGFSYALFSYIRTSSNGFEIKSGNIKLGYFEGNSGISLSNSLPISDSDVLSNTSSDSYFDFYVSYGVNDVNLKYEIDIVNNSSNNSDVVNGLYDELDTSMVKVSLLKKDTQEFVVDSKYFSELEGRSASNGKSGFYLYSAIINNADATDNYRLYMWIPLVDDANNAISPLVGATHSSANKVFSVKLNIQASANAE